MLRVSIMKFKVGSNFVKGSGNHYLWFYTAGVELEHMFIKHHCRGWTINILFDE